MNLPFRYAVVSEPAVEPVSLAEAKAHLRVTSSDEDTEITMLIEAARRMVEREGWHALITQTWDVYLDAFPSGDTLRLPNPLQSVTGVYYTPDGGAEQTMSAGDYIVDTTIPARLTLAVGASWPGDALQSIAGVRVRVVVGFGSAGSDVPATLRSAVLLAMAHLYENREAVVVDRGLSAYTLPLGLRWLLSDWRERAR